MSTTSEKRLVGPRIGPYRAPTSFSADVVEALAGYRHALREFDIAMVAQRVGVSQMLPGSVLNKLHATASAAALSLSAALETLHATLRED